MVDVVLGRAVGTVLVDLDVCAKTGRPTSQRVTLRGSTTPGWVVVVLLLTVVGLLLALAMTSRRYRLTLPLVHGVYLRWKWGWLVAVVVGLAGVGAAVAAVSDHAGRAGLWGGVGIALVAVALVGGTVNATVNGLGVRRTGDGDLVLRGAHPAFAEAVAAASADEAVR